MGRLTDDMARLVGEIHATRETRGRLMRDLTDATVEMKRTVAGMQAGFRSARTDMARRQQRMLRGFVSGLTATVTGLRKGMADDLSGAQKAWGGVAAETVPGRARRGGKRFDRENA